MSERKCEEHGALEVFWDTVDIPDKDGKPRCWVCDLEAEKERLMGILKTVAQWDKYAEQELKE